MPRDNPIITSAMVGLFVLGMLYKNFLGQIKQWIHDKVAESNAASGITTGPGGILQTPPGPNGEPPLDIYT